MPALVNALIFRDGRASYAPFEQEATYIFSGCPEQSWWDTGTHIFECTKGMMALKVYATLARLGAARLRAYIERMLDLACWFAARLRAAGFEVVDLGAQAGQHGQEMLRPHHNRARCR